MYVVVDGAIVDESKATISVLNPAFQFGEGVFTTARVLNKKVELFEAHLKRIIDSAISLGIESPIIDPHVILHLVDMYCDSKVPWKLKIIVIPEGARSRYFAFVEPFLQPMPEVFRLSTVLSEIPFTSRIKTLSYLDRKLAKKMATKSGFDEVLFIDAKGHILETGCANIFWKKGKIVFTPSRQLPLLRGVTIAAIEKALVEMGYEIREVEQKVDELDGDACVYVCNVMLRYAPVIRINNQYFTRDTDFEKKLGIHLNSL